MKFFTGSGQVGRIFAGLLAAVLGGGCHRSTPVSEGDRSSTLQVATVNDFADLDPATGMDGEEDRVLRALFEGLVRYDQAHRIRPGAAERWETSADGLTWTFHLRPNLQWSNGAPLTAQDFVYSMRRFLDPPLACEQASYAWVIAGARDFNEGRTTDPAGLGITAVDPRTLVIRLDHPCLYLPAILATSGFMPVYGPLVARYHGERARGAAWTKPGVLVSNGPFVLRAWKQDSVLSVAKNAHYWGAPGVQLAQIDFHPVDDPIAMEHGFRAGQYHLTTAVPVRPAQEDIPDHARLYGPGRRCQFLTFNVARHPFSDARIRRALSLAISRTRLVQATMGRLGAPAFSYAYPGLGGYDPGRPDPYNPTLARELLAQAGYPEGRGFPPVSLMLIGKASATLQIGEVIQESWRSELHIDTQLAPTEMKVFLDAERTKHYTVVLDTWSPDWDDPTSVYLTAETANPNNDSGWSSAEADAAFHDAERSVDPARRRRDFARIETVLAQEVPYAPLYYVNQGAFVAPSVRGFTPEEMECPDWTSLHLNR